MLVIAVLTLLICAAFGVNLYFLLLIRKSLIKNKIKLSQVSSSSKQAQEQIKVCENKLDAVTLLLHELETKSSLSVKNRDSIEHQYDRAKRILKNNALVKNDNLLQSCDMTAEEIELLSGLMNHHD